MVNTKLNIFKNNFAEKLKLLNDFQKKIMSNNFLPQVFLYLPQVFLFLVATFFMAPDAFAQAGDTMAGLCKVAGWVQKILTAAAVIAVLLYVINSFFLKSSVVGDIILYVIIGCAIATAVVYLIGLTGLNTSGCSLT